MINEPNCERAQVREGLDFGKALRWKEINDLDEFKLLSV